MTEARGLLGQHAHVAVTPERWAVLSPLLDTALDLPADQRRDFAAAVRVGDATLPAQLAWMIAACDRDESIIDGTAAERFASLIAAPIISPDPSVELAAVRTALRDRYRVEHKIASGGMATVYLAYDERDDRHVAIKVLRPGFAAALPVDRFLREIRVTAALQHPHILPLYDSGDVDGIVYYVMPFIDGESLRGRLHRLKQLPLERALRITRFVADALSYAHSKGVIHRDIKPENILLANAGGDGAGTLQVFVADFGVAVAMQNADDARLTQSGVSIGTPAYMSPEQAAAKRTIGPPSDVYALAAVFYEMLNGQPPIGGPSGLPIIARVISEVPVPLGRRMDGIPAHIDAAVIKALAKSPADRFPGVAEFVSALDDVSAPAKSPYL